MVGVHIYFFSFDAYILNGRVTNYYHFYDVLSFYKSMSLQKNYIESKTNVINFLRVFFKNIELHVFLTYESVSTALMHRIKFKENALLHFLSLKISSH